MTVKSGKEIIRALNEVLTGELTAINQYFLHAKMCEDWGYMRLYKKIYQESIEEMQHAENIISRILYLDGIPNVQRLDSINIGQTVEEQFQSDMRLEQLAIPRLNKAIELCRKHGDNGTRSLLETILNDEEEHLDWLESQLSLIEQVGLSAYLSEQITTGA